MDVSYILSSPINHSKKMTYWIIFQFKVTLARNLHIINKNCYVSCLSSWVENALLHCHSL